MNGIGKELVPKRWGIAAGEPGEAGETSCNIIDLIYVISERKEETYQKI